MKPKAQYGCVELKVNTLQVIWLKHTGELDRIASKHRVMICYADDKVLLTSGNKNYCEEAQAEVDCLFRHDFTMQLHTYKSDFEIKAFIRVFSNQDYRNFCIKNKGFWIYNRHSLMKHLENMQKEVDYKGVLPELPEYFVIIWLPILNINQIKKKVDDLIGVQLIDWDKGEKSEEINITHMEAISIFLTLNVERIEQEQSVQINLIQNYQQFTISIKGVFVDKAFSVLQKHLTKRFLSPYCYNGTPLSPKMLDQLQNELNQQVKWQSDWKLFSQEEIEGEAKKLDRLFGTHLVTNQRSNTQQIFIFGDVEKQKDISDKITLLIRNINWDINQSNNYSYQSTQSTNRTIGQSAFQEPYDGLLSNILYDNKDPKQTDQPFQNTFQFKQNQFTYNYKYGQDNFPIQQQQQIPLRNYKAQDYNYEYSSNIQVEQQAPLRGYKGKAWQPSQQERNYQDTFQKQSTIKRQNYQKIQYIPKQDCATYEYRYQEPPPEEEKISQLIQISDLTKLFKRTIVKFTPQLYRITYVSKKHIDMQQFKQSFAEFSKNIKNEKNEASTLFSKDQLSIQLKVEEEDQVKLLAEQYDKFFSNTKYFVTQFTSTSKQFLEVLSLRYEVESLQTNAEHYGFITAEEYQQLGVSTLNCKQVDGKNLAMKVTYTYHDQGQFEMDFQNFQTGLAFQQESSILEVSTSSVNSKLVMVLPQQQLEFIQQNYPEVEAQKLSKQANYLKSNFYYVQMENKLDKINEIKERLIQQNLEIVNSFITFKKEFYKGQKLIKIKQDQNYCLWKVQLYKNIQNFYIKLLNDQIEQQYPLEEFQNKSRQHPFKDITIDIGSNRIQKDKDFQLLENEIFGENSKYKMSTTKVIELPRGNFLVLMVRENVIHKIKHISELDSENSLIRGYVENH